MNHLQSHRVLVFNIIDMVKKKQYLSKKEMFSSSLAWHHKDKSKQVKIITYNYYLRQNKTNIFLFIFY